MNKQGNHQLFLFSLRSKKRVKDIYFLAKLERKNEEHLFWSQPYKINLVFKNNKLVLTFLMVHYFQFR